MTHTSYSQLLMAPLHQRSFSVPQKHLLYQYLIAEYGGEKMCIRGLQRIGVQNIGVLPEAQGGGPSGWHRQRRGSSGERDFVPRIHGKSAGMGVGRRFLRWPHIAVFADPSVCIAGFVRRHFSRGLVLSNAAISSPFLSPDYEYSR